MFEPLPAKFSFPEAEKAVLKFWDEHDIFGKSIAQRAGGAGGTGGSGGGTAGAGGAGAERAGLDSKDGVTDHHGGSSGEAGGGAKRFVFYEGPPTANGMPHPGHCLTRAMKDLFPRYRAMCGYLVERKGGWDTHGLPVEREVEKELMAAGEMKEMGKAGIEAYGVEKFVLKCINSVWRYTREWEAMTRRLGFWVNLPDAYVTYHQSYVESVWWSLKTLFERGLLYQAHKVVWWWCQGGTALSSGEVGEGYRTVDDPSVYVKFPLVDPSPVESAPVADAGSIGVPPVRPDTSSASSRNPVTEDLTKRRRILPHWEAGGSTYFLTFRMNEGMLADAERTLVLDACRHWDGQRMILHAAVVMPDHVHLLCTPLEKEKGVWWSIADLMHGIKSFTAKEINRLRARQGIVWQREYFDRIIRNQSDFDEKWNYIVTNPQKRGLPDDYAWTWIEGASASRRCDVNAQTHRPEADAPRDARDAQTHRRDADAPRSKRTSLLVWTTTPWTLISNHFAAVHPELEYALVHDPVDDEYLYIAKPLVEAIAKKVKRELTVVGTCRGTELVGLRYVPPFPGGYYSREVRELGGVKKKLGETWGDLRLPLSVTGQDSTETANSLHWDYAGWRVLAADFVTLEAGTGLVHEAPAFGEVDFNLWKQEGARFIGGLPMLCAVEPDGTFNSHSTPSYRGRWVKDCDKEICRDLRERGLLYHQETYKHEYPFCPRAENDPLIQYARKSWFVRTSQFKDDMLANNHAVNWLPREGIGGDRQGKGGRFGDFLANNVDWALSRERFWGTPLPIWVCEKCGKMDAIGSFAELRGKPGATDGGFWDKKVAEHRAAGDTEMPEHLRVHKPYVDEWTYDSPCCGMGFKPVQSTVKAGASPINRQDADTTPVPRMRRVPEVIDCWWDAGSMPFAQWGYPHAPESVETFQSKFPADFISEAIDQTRGWFYGLLAISTLLFGGANPKSKIQNPKSPADAAVRDGRSGDAGGPSWPMPYRTCIVLGHMNGEDGNKMSKRLRNYKEPTYIFDQYGADAMRWYFFSAQVPWTTTRFVEANIRDAQREFLVRLYNVFSFFNIYANIDGFTPIPTPEYGHRPTKQRSELDRWIISELQRTIRFVREKMDAFENYPAAQRINDFVDALSNWYVRRSRDRFWKPIDNEERRTKNEEDRKGGASAPSAFFVQRSDFSLADQDKWDAYHTLYGCLWTLAQLIAPFTPFFAETMYQNLRGIKGARDQGIKDAVDAADARDEAVASIQNPKSKIQNYPISVHLCDYPVADESLIDEALAAEMDLVRDIVSLGRAARTSAKLKVRQPLARVEVILANREHEEWLSRHAELIADELNVKSVDFTTQAEHYVSYQVKPNFKTIGPKFGALKNDVAAALGKVDAAVACESLAGGGSLTLHLPNGPVKVTSDEVEVRLEAKPGWSASQGRAGVVVVSTELAQELRDEGLIRELIHLVQGMRKDKALAYQARIALFIEAPAEFAAIVRNFDKIIQAECLADRIQFTAGAEMAEFEVEGHKVRLGIALA